MTRKLLGLFSGDAPPEVVVAALEHVIDQAREEHEMDTVEPTRLDPDGGDPSDPYSEEGLRQAEEDRLLQMAVYGLTEEDFGDSAIWLADGREEQ